MKCVVQKVSRASVAADGRIRGQIDPPTGGLLVLCGLEDSDTDADLSWMSEKLVHLRIFPDEQGKMNRSLLELHAQTQGTRLLLIPNFTLAGDAARGRRPSFDRAMRPERASVEFERFVEMCRSLLPGVGTGVFQTHMHVELVNDGPVTIILDSSARRAKEK